jgi:DNA-binding winged helix-turn-helix (wHTH) protein/TolB-like protein/lipoprotein NlpI
VRAILPVEKGHCYEFGNFRLDPREKILFCDDKPVSLTPKVFDTLQIFVEHAGHLLSKDELIQSLWQDRFVEESNLTFNIRMLRRVLKDDVQHPRYIETVPRRGYRFIAGVRKLEANGELMAREPSPAPPLEAKQPAPSLESSVETRDVSEQKALATSGVRAIFRENPVQSILTANLLLALLVAGVYLVASRKPEHVADPAVKSLAVLPFKSLSADGSDDYLGMGIGETLTTRLSSLRLLTVRPTSAIHKYATAEKESAVVGRELGVDSVLEGSIQRADERIRVTARLVSVRDGSLLWADNFDESFTDIFKVEDSISGKVAAALALKLSGEQQKHLTKRYTEDAEAYRLYLKGRYFWNKRTEEDFNRGIAQFQQAIEKDPGYALAYAGLADSYIGLTFYNFAVPHETMPKAKAAAMKGLALDNTLAEAHTSLAHVLANYDWNWSEAEKEFKLSIELKPDYATAHQWYAIHYLTATGRLEEALQEMKKALELEPTSLVMNTFVGATLYYMGRYDEAIDQCRKTIEMDPNFAVAHWHLGLAYEQKQMSDAAIEEFQKSVSLSGDSPLMIAALGHAYAMSQKKREANKILHQLNELAKQRYVSPYEVAAIYVALGNNEQAFQFLEKAYKEHSFHLVYLNVWPQFKPIRSDPRFQDLVQRIGLSR